MTHADLTDLDRREVTLWRVVGRYDEALALGDVDQIIDLDLGFKRRLAAYELAHQEAAPV